MVKIDGNNVYRGAEKIGFISGNYIYDQDGDKVGYFEDNYVYDREGNRQAYIQEDYLESYSGSSSKVSLDKINESVEGGVLSEIGKCAVYLLLGD
jgi:hypothetical protein